MPQYSAWLTSRDAKGYSLTVKLYPLALPFHSWPAARDAKGYSRTVRLYPLALHFCTWLAARDAKGYSCSTSILKAFTRNLGSARSFSSLCDSATYQVRTSKETGAVHLCTSSAGSCSALAKQPRIYARNGTERKCLLHLPRSFCLPSSSSTSIP
jgi:hypothetical protein